MTVVGFCALVYVMVTRVYDIYKNRSNDFDTLAYTYSKDEMGELNIDLGRFNETLNFIFGLTSLPEDGSFDIQNNPYVEFLGLEVTNGKAHMVENKYVFEPCSQFHKDKFIQSHAQGWYD